MRQTFTGRGVVRKGVLIRAALGLAACALTAAVYVPVLENPFVLDDRTAVLLNPSLTEVFGWRGILLYDRWHPLVNVSYAIDHALWGLSSFGFHITNGLLHVFVVALLYTLLTRRQPQGASLARLWAGFIAAAAFGTNPLTARSAAYVAARADMLFAAAVLVVFLLSLRAFETSSRWLAVAAGVVVAVGLAATPWGAAAAHGPLRLYLTTAVMLGAAAWWAGPTLCGWRAGRAAGVLAIGVLILFTRRTLTAWGDPVELWRQEVARAPGAWDAHLGYADALREASHCADAARQYRAALQLNPGLEDARRGLAQCGLR